MNMKKMMKKILNIAEYALVSILAGFAVAVLVVLRIVAKYANVLALAGVIAILVMLCQ